jgi:hypothetical protein
MWIHASRRYPLVACAILAVLAPAACGGTAQERAGEAGDPSGMTLIRGDLPPGYRVGDDSGCGPMGTEGAPARLAALVRDAHPQVCVTQLERIYGSEPPLVESAAVVFEGEEAAERGLGIAAQFVHYLMGEAPERLRRVETPDAPGDEGFFLASSHFTVEGVAGKPGRVLAWRSGPVVAAVLVGGVPEAAAAQRAMALGRLQQMRIEHPEPVTTTSDAEVALDDPALQVPVVWLGPTFAPDGFPRVDLFDASRVGPGSGPGNQLKLDYDSPDFRAGLHLDVWTPRAWARFRRTELGRTLWSSRCTTTRQLRLPDRSATLFAGYERDVGAQCPTTPADAHLAAVRIAGVVVTVNMPYCLGCLQQPPGYDSREGVEAVVRALRVRP